MALLLADVGGTNARLAIARNGVIDPETVTRFRGDDFASFDDVIAQFLQQQDQPRISGVCVAVAGPVSGGTARLTNRDWDFDENRLARLTDADHVRLINDLTALGYATPALQGDGLSTLRPARPDRARNGQSLVVGLGTGFNVCAVRALPGGAVTAMEAEEGHTNLPANIYLRLADLLGEEQAAGFRSTEETFAGRGLSRLHGALTGQTGCAAKTSRRLRARVIRTRGRPMICLRNLSDCCAANWPCASCRAKGCFWQAVSGAASPTGSSVSNPVSFRTPSCVTFPRTRPFI